MAKQKYGWQDGLQAAMSKGGGSDDRDNQGQKKKISRLMYRRRKLDKDVRQYTRSKTYRISGKRINRIGREHGFFIEGTPFRKDSIPPKDA